MRSCKICLNMIVKDEAPVIKRCLDSIKHLIDYYVIVDTGSRDGTQDIIRECLQGLTGELHEKPWVDFAYNRNEAMQLARGKADYLLFIDADETISYGTQFTLPELTLDCYLINVEQAGAKFQRAFLINNRANWQWVGVLHEEIVCDRQTTWEALADCYINARNLDGNRSKDPEKFLKDAAVLEKELEKQPHNARYLFYLGQIYLNSNQLDLALKTYEKRASLEGWEQEKYWALYAMGVLQEQLEYPEELYLQSYQTAFTFRKTRAEPLFCLIQYYFKKKNFIAAYALAKLAIAIPLPNDIVYVQHWVYEYGIRARLADSALALGLAEEAYKNYEILLQIPHIPPEMRAATTKILQTQFSMQV